MASVSTISSYQDRVLIRATMRAPPVLIFRFDRQMLEEGMHQSPRANR
jgi:hypothetical protein